MDLHKQPRYDGYVSIAVSSPHVILILPAMLAPTHSYRFPSAV